MSTPVQQSPITINAHPATRFNLTRWRNPQNKWKTPAAPLTDKAPFRLHRGDVAILCTFDEDSTYPVEGLSPFFTSFNGCGSGVPSDLTALGIVAIDIAEDMSSPDGPQEAVAVQVGGIATIRNTGNVVINAGDIVAIRAPDDRCSDLTSPTDSVYQGVILPITYPLVPFDSQRMLNDGVPRFLHAASQRDGVANMAFLKNPEEFCHNGDTRGMMSAALATAFMAGVTMAVPLLRTIAPDTAFVGNAWSDPVMAMKASARLLGLYGPGSGSNERAIEATIQGINVPPQLEQVRKDARVLSVAIVSPRAEALKMQGVPRLESQIEGTMQMLGLGKLMASIPGMISGSVTTQANKVRRSILGLALSRAAPGNAFDIKLGESYMV